MNSIGQVQTPWGVCDVVLARYTGHGKALAVTLQSPEGEPFGVFSTNIADASKLLGEREFFAKTYAENARLVEPMLQSGLFEATDKTVKSAYIDAPIWRIKDHVTDVPKR